MTSLRDHACTPLKRDLYNNAGKANGVCFSTISSGLNGIATCFVEDLIRGYCVKDLTDAKAARYTQIVCKLFLTLLQFARLDDESVHPSVCLSTVCLSVCPSVRPTNFKSNYLSVYLSAYHLSSHLLFK